MNVKMAGVIYNVGTGVKRESPLPYDAMMNQRRKVRCRLDFGDKKDRRLILRVALTKSGVTLSCRLFGIVDIQVDHVVVCVVESPHLPSFRAIDLRSPLVACRHWRPD
jgi:hypothetical protein